MTLTLSASSSARVDAVTGAVERLAAEFPALTRRTVVRVVRRSRADLSGVPDGALPELLERLARQRLTDHGRG
ncbi:MAG: hypothetical protein OJJ54_02100 [Pseudonocardia sp.]|nr:hypothetical protein [Pseudonocardia sp.]